MSYTSPPNLAQAAMLASENEGSVFIAGGTDLMVRRSLGLDTAQHLVDLSQIAELRGITLDDNSLSIGATTTLAELAANPIVRSRFPALSEAALAIASPAIRNSATVAGNLLCENRCVYYDQSEFWQSAAGGCLKCGADVCIATGSAKHCYSVFISDLAPVLICLDASIEVFSAAGSLLKPVEWLYTGDGLAPHSISSDDIITRIVIPLRGGGDWLAENPVRFRKIRPRASVDFTNLTVAIRRTQDGITIAVSGVGPAPAVVRNATVTDPNELAAALLKQSKIIDNVSYRRLYRKEMLTETILSMMSGE